MNNINFASIDPAVLETVAGGIDWGASFDKAFDWAGKGGTVGTLGGAAVGSVVPGAGTLTGAGVGGLGGTAVGFVGGLAKGVYDTWNK